VDAADLAAVLSYAAALPEGTLSSPGIANRTGYCGYRFAPETEMYLARNRWLSPPLGRWIERDPLGYVNGSSLYLSSLGSPLTFFDWSGLDVYLCARDLDGSPIGNHQFLYIAPSSGRRCWPRAIFPTREGFTLGGFKEDDGCMRLQVNQEADVASVRELMAPCWYHCGLRASERYKSGWSGECKKVPLPPGMSEKSFIDRLLACASQYEKNSNAESGCCVRYDIRYRNCQSFAQGLLACAGVDAETACTLGDMAGVDWGYDYPLSRQWFEPGGPRLESIDPDELRRNVERMRLGRCF